MVLHEEGILNEDDNDDSTSSSQVTKTITKTITKTPLISVIVPVYNAAPYLRRCVDSLLAQSFTDFELILVDDGSTDGSSIICDEYSLNSTRVHVIHQQNAGVSTARNVGIESARGEYISFVDADDWVEPDFLKAFAEEITKTKGENDNENDNENVNENVNENLNLNKKGVDCVVQGYVNHEGRRIQEPYTFYGSAKEIGENLYHLEEKRLIGYVWNKVFRRQMIVRHHVRFSPAIPIGEDFLFCMEAVSHCQSMSVVPVVGYNYFYPQDDHKDYPFAAWNRRLDSFAALLPTMEMMPDAVASAFKAKDFKMSLYVLRIAYHEQLPRPQRQAYLEKIKSWGKGNKAIHICRYEPSFFVLAILALYMPFKLSDALLMLLRRFR